jgi:cell wall-associated NlpC family hydrolase
VPVARTFALRALVIVGVACALTLPASSAAAAPSLEEIERQIRTLSAEMTRVVEEYNTANVRLSRIRAAAAEAAARLPAAEAEADAAVAEIGDLMARAYMTGEIGAVRALLDAGSANRLLDRAAALDQVARIRNAQLAQATAAQARAEEEKRKLDELLAAETATQQTLAAKKAQIEKDLSRLYALREQAYGAARESASGQPAPPPPPVSGAAGVAVRYAYAALGKPYEWAADGPDSYDCSGLTMAAWRAAGKSLSHSASIQYRETARISRSQLQPGDLVFYNNLGHVAIYVGNGQVIHAPTFGEVVKLASVDMMPPYGYGRVR